MLVNEETVGNPILCLARWKTIMCWTGDPETLSYALLKKTETLSSARAREDRKPALRLAGA
jgi:hypothetical protein